MNILARGPHPTRFARHPPLKKGRDRKNSARGDNQLQTIATLYAACPPSIGESFNSWLTKARSVIGGTGLCNS
jgi:hypothetical protein